MGLTDSRCCGTFSAVAISDLGGSISGKASPMRQTFPRLPECTDMVTCRAPRFAVSSANRVSVRAVREGPSDGT